MIYPELTGGASTTSSVKHHVASCINQTWKELLLNVFPNKLDFTPVVSRLYIIKYHIKIHDYLDILDTLPGQSHSLACQLELGWKGPSAWTHTRVSRGPSSRVNFSTMVTRWSGSTAAGLELSALWLIPLQVNYIYIHMYNIHIYMYNIYIYV